MSDSIEDLANPVSFSKREDSEERTALSIAPSEPRLSEFVANVAPMQQAADLHDLFTALAESVTAALHADGCVISLVDEDDGVVRDFAAAVGNSANPRMTASEYRLGHYPKTRDVIYGGGSLEVSAGDSSADNAETDMLTHLGFKRMLMCRLALEGRAIGLVEVFRLDDRGFRAEDPAEVESLCDFAAKSYARIQLLSRQEESYTSTLEAIVSSLEARDPYTRQNTGRIKDMAVALSIASQVTGEERRAIRLGAILHDVGKIGIPDEILLKPGALSEEEWTIMRQHPVMGERMLQGIEFLDAALPIIRHHHELWDGVGYPDGLKGELIPLGARIVSVCDAFDAMTSERPYREAMSIERACDEIACGAGTQFDPRCSAMLVEVVTGTGGVRMDDWFVRYAG
jgi:HD domain